MPRNHIAKPKRKVRSPKLRLWTQADIDLYIKLFPNHTNQEIATRLGRTVVAIKSFRIDQGMLWLKKKRSHNLIARRPTLALARRVQARLDKFGGKKLITDITI